MTCFSMTQQKFQPKKINNNNALFFCTVLRGLKWDSYMFFFYTSLLQVATSGRTML